MTRIKICGITRPEDGMMAAEEGADAIGLVFAPASPRCVDIRKAGAIAAALPPFVTTVALFVDAEAAFIDAVLKAVPVDLIQFHGSETPEACAAFGRPYLKAICMAPGVDARAEAIRYRSARGILLDAWSDRLAGGTGEVFDWSRVPRDLGLPLVLAGGLNGDNVREAVERVRPWGVDVSSGVEREKGIKDRSLIRKFMAALEHPAAPTA